MILPMVKYLESYGVQFHFGVKVTNVEFDCNEQRKLATRIDTLRDGKEEHIDLTENDLVFITNGGCVENSSIGDQNTPAKLRRSTTASFRISRTSASATRSPARSSPAALFP